MESETEWVILQQECECLLCPPAGHSRTVVGLEQKRTGKLCLLVLDPASSAPASQGLLSRSAVSTAVRGVRKFPGSLKHRQYQLVVAQGVLSAQERQVRRPKRHGDAVRLLLSCNAALTFVILQIKIMHSKTLCAEKIP